MQTFKDFLVWMRPLKQAAVAAKLGVSEATLSRMKSGRQPITPDIAAKVEELSHGVFAKERVLWPDKEAPQSTSEDDGSLRLPSEHERSAA